MTEIMRRATRETMFIPGRQRGERRRQFRSLPAGAYPTSFTFGGVEFTAILKDVSRRGAALQVEQGWDARLEKGIVLEMQIRTPWEVVHRKGRVCWTKDSGSGFQLGVEYVELPTDADCIGLLDMDKVKIDPVWALRVPANLAVRRQVLPFAFSNNQVYVACVDTRDQATLQAVEKLLGSRICVEPAEPESLQRALDRVYGSPQGNGYANGDAKARSVDLRSPSEAQQGDIVLLCDELMHAAILRQASDIHIDPEEDGVQIRFRVDGMLEDYRKTPPATHSGLISRFKVQAGIDIAEKRAPQDGGFKHRFGRTGQAIDIRVATLPTKHGERMTLRLLALQTESLTLENLGMSEKDLGCFTRCIDQPHGLILLTGPTGSGKSTTLYAAIRRILARENLNILTVEDPIEYAIKGVAQVEVDSADKVTFVKALRSVLRHDPDVVMIGEIRDGETADVAIKSSLTGHLVFSTLHTNSAVSVITRLVDMGVDRFLIAATLRLAVAQRLVRRLCPRCRTARTLTQAEAVALKQPELVGRTIYDPVGCIYCAGKGYLGRLGIFELLPIDEDWARSISLGADETEFSRRMRDEQRATLLTDGCHKLFAGDTSLRDLLGAVSIW
ncbi:MAG: ATPase, T2SS/T4P/T4SS family [Gemmataceae bacterium]